MLWRRWHDLRCWAILAPKAVVFVNEKREELSAGEAREAICKTLLTIHRNFEHALRYPEQNLIGVSLHKAYAAFYQFLLPEDMDANQVEEQGVFATLRREIRRTLDAWLEPLHIEQEYAAGPPRTREYLANVRKAAPRNIRLTRQDWLLEKMITPPRENQVVYWLKPKWRQMQPGSTELPGSVLYVFD